MSEAVQIPAPFFSDNLADIPGWTHAGPQGDALLWAKGYNDGGGTVYATGDGNQFVTLGGGCCGRPPGSPSWTTTIDGLTSGARYVVHFMTSNETDALSQTMMAQVDSGPVLSYTPPNMAFANYWGNWTAESYAFVAAGSSASLTFSVDSIVQDMGLDAVSVSAGIPESSTWAMMLAGFAALGFLGYRASGRRAVAA